MQPQRGSNNIKSFECEIFVREAKSLISNDLAERRGDLASP